MIRCEHILYLHCNLTIDTCKCLKIVHYINFTIHVNSNHTSHFGKQNIINPICRGLVQCFDAGGRV